MSRENAFDGRRALVLGASGFIGRWVAGRLEGLGCEVIPIVRDLPAARAALDMATVAATPLVVDLLDPGELERLIGELRPRLTFNLAGYGVDRSERDPDVARRINADLPETLAGALLRLTSRGSPDGGSPGSEPPILIHVGSALEYGVADRVGEDDPAEPTTDYGRTKLRGTEAIATAVRAGLRATTARLFTVYGPGEHPGRLLPTLMDAAGTDDPIELTEGLQKRDFTFVDDVVEGLVRLAGCVDPPSVVNLATGQLTTVRRFVELAARELLLGPGQLRFGAHPGLTDEMEHAPVPVERLDRALGWRPDVSIPEGVRRTIEVLETGERVA